MLWTSRRDPVFLMRRRLIASMGRLGLRPVFDPNVLGRLALIALGQSAFALDEIALMLAPDGRPRIDREMIAAKAEGLQHAAACRAQHMECPMFRRILRAATSGAIGARKKASRYSSFACVNAISRRSTHSLVATAGCTAGFTTLRLEFRRFGRVCHRKRLE